MMKMNGFVCFPQIVTVLGFKLRDHLIPMQALYWSEAMSTVYSLVGRVPTSYSYGPELETKSQFLITILLTSIDEMS